MKVNLVVEGASDQGAAQAVVEAAGGSVARIITKGGKAQLDRDIVKYNCAASHAPWIVFRDSDSVCPVHLRHRLTGALPTIAPHFLFRIAHSMTEAWLLADRDSFSDYFSLRLAHIPKDVEELQHAKRSVLSLCANSRSRAIRRDMVTGAGETGPLYVLRINDYASTTWRPAIAQGQSQSLRRAVDRISDLVAEL